MKKTYKITLAGKVTTMTIEGRDLLLKSEIVNSLCDSASRHREEGLEYTAEYLMDIARQIWAQDEEE